MPDWAHTRRMAHQPFARATGPGWRRPNAWTFARRRGDRLPTPIRDSPLITPKSTVGLDARWATLAWSRATIARLPATFAWSSPTLPWFYGDFARVVDNRGLVAGDCPKVMRNRRLVLSDRAEVVRSPGSVAGDLALVAGDLALVAGDCRVVASVRRGACRRTWGQRDGHAPATQCPAQSTDRRPWGWPSGLDFLTCAPWSLISSSCPFEGCAAQTLRMSGWHISCFRQPTCLEVTPWHFVSRSMPGPLGSFSRFH
jgi:hypothetical protein